MRLPPPLTLLVLYGALVVIGAGLLKLKPAQALPVTWGEALFTSASAVTVTGLGVIDIGTHLTFLGQAVVMALIQLGGLGLMVFAVLILSALGMPVGLPRQLTLREDLGQASVRDLGKLVRTIALVVATCEGAGALLLAPVFIDDHGFWPGLWHAAFLSVSSFNNAGFSLFPDSLIGYAVDPVVNLVIPALFIVGGLGFAVIADVARQRRWGPLMLHSKLMLIGTAALILWGWGAFAALEWTNPRTLAAWDHGWQRAMVAWFQGVTPRTAGFNTTDTGGMHDSSTFLTITLMLVGGGPTSTAGGIKVTTLICLMLAVVAFFRRSTELHAFGRSIPLEDMLRMTALVSVSMLFVGCATFVILISHDGEFRDLLFEVASAFGTVGMSRGATAELDAIGRTVIIALMFAGRVGPLTLGFFLATRSRPRIRYARGSVFLG